MVMMCLIFYFLDLTSLKIVFAGNLYDDAAEDSSDFLSPINHRLISVTDTTITRAAWKLALDLQKTTKVAIAFQVKLEPEDQKKCLGEQLIFE